MSRSRNSKEVKNKLLPLEAKTKNQKDYIRSIVENTVVICSGPSGSGKSYIAAGMAAHQIHRKESEIERIIVTRPLVCAGKDMGALPGVVGERIAPYLQPMEENLKHFLSQSWYGHYYNSGKIQYRPLELMRGATFHNSYMILDEAQNCTKEQLKMFISRMGRDSKVLINGDIKQDDLTGRSGLDFCMERLSEIEGVACCALDYSDIQRHDLTGAILQALED